MEFDPGDLDLDSEQLKLWMRNGRGGRGAAGGGAGIGPGSGFQSAFGSSQVGSGSGIGGETLTPRQRLLQRMSAASAGVPSSYADGGPVMGGPPGVDTVPAMVDNGEGILNRVAMRTPGMLKFMNALNALAALELGPEGEEPMGMDGTQAHEGAESMGMEQSEDAGGYDPEQDVEGYFLGGLMDKIPVVGKTMHKVASVAAPIALTAMGVPAPLAAGISNFAMEGSADDLGGSLGNAAMAGGTTYVGGKMMANRANAANKANLSAMPVPDAPPDLSAIGETAPRHYAYGGYVSTPRQSAAPGIPGLPGQGQAAAPWKRPPGTGFPMPGATPTPAPPNAFATPPPSAGNQWLQDQAKAAGVFDPNGNRAAIGAAQTAMRQRGQAQERGDVNSLAVSGMTDPSLYTSMLMQQRHERGIQEGSDLAQMRAGFAKDAGDFAQGMYQSDSDHAWQNYLDFLNVERQKQLKKTKGK